MQRFLALAALALGLALLFRRRRRQALPPPAPAPSPHADELRARLAESRAAEEIVPDEAPEQAESAVDGRRRELHDAARRSIDELAT